MHEDVVHALDHAVAVDPRVLAVAVGPVAVDPDASGTERGGLVDCNHTWRWRRHLTRSDRLRLLDDDDRLAFDLLSSAFFDLDHHVVGRLDRSDRFGARRLTPTWVSIVRDLEVARRVRRAVPGNALVVGGSRKGECRS